MLPEPIKQAAICVPEIQTEILEIQDAEPSKGTSHPER
jgi:hypothetical protein